jgi:hypothetical protein
MSADAESWLSTMTVALGSAVRRAVEAEEIYRHLDAMEEVARLTMEVA